MRFLMKSCAWRVFLCGFKRNRIRYMFRRRRRIRRRRGTRHYRTNKEVARAVILEKVKRYNEIYQYSLARISIRNQKTRWGSCSKSGNLNFNYKILFLEEPLADYIVVHELCHLKELNHSKKFWTLVAEVCADYKDMKRELKRRDLRLS